MKFALKSNIHLLIGTLNFRINSYFYRIIVQLLISHMINTILILFNTPKALNQLDQEFETALWRKSCFILSVYGLLSLLVNFSPSEDSALILREASIFSILLTVLIGLATAFILLKLGHHLGGKAQFIDLLAVVAHSIIPKFIGLIVIYFLGAVSIIHFPFWANVIFYLSLFMTYKILFQGVKRFHGFSTPKTIVTLSPLFLTQLVLTIWISNFAW